MPLYNNRHHERGHLLLTTLIAIDHNPGMKTAEIADIVVPEKAAEIPGYIGWWFGSYLRAWHSAGFVHRRYSPKKQRCALRYYLTNKGVEVLLSRGLKRA